MIKSPEQGWAWDGTASPKDFCPSDMSPKAQNPGTVSAIFVPVPSVERESVPLPVPSPGTEIPWDPSPFAHPWSRTEPLTFNPQFF